MGALRRRASIAGRLEQQKKRRDWLQGGGAELQRVGNGRKAGVYLLGGLAAVMCSEALMGKC